MKIGKLASLIFLVFFIIAQVNEICGQMVTKNERIFWNNFSDSITIFHPLFANACYDEDYNTSLFVSKYTINSAEWASADTSAILLEIHHKAALPVRWFHK